jgi:hypothetical protein
MPAAPGEHGGRVREVDANVAAVDVFVTIAGQRGGCGQDGLAIHLELGFVLGRVEDLVADRAEATAASAAASGVPVGEVGPALVLREDAEGDEHHDDAREDQPVHAQSVRRGFVGWVIRRDDYAPSYGTR